MTIARSISVFGYSDDLVEVEGDASIEASSYGIGVPIVINGVTAATIEYGAGGLWHITPRDALDGVTMRLVAALGENTDKHPDTDIPGYSDIAFFDGAITSISICGDEVCFTD